MLTALAILSMKKQRDGMIGGYAGYKSRRVTIEAGYGILYHEPTWIEL